MPMPVQNPHLTFTPADEPILAAFGRYFFLTAAQVTRLVYAPGSHTYAQARLKHLADSDYLQRLFLPRPTRTGSAPLVYTVARKGLTALQILGHEVNRRYRPAEVRELAYLHLAHTLSLNDVLIAFELVCRQRPELQLVEQRHERSLKLTPTAVQLPDGSHTSVIPDGWLDLRIGGRYQACLCLELDRGTHEQRRWRRKVAALLAYAQGPYQQAFGTDVLTIVVIATPGGRRCAELLRWTEAELTQQGREDLADLFRFTGISAATAAPDHLLLTANWRRPFGPHPVALMSLEDVRS